MYYIYIYVNKSYIVPVIRVNNDNDNYFSTFEIPACTLWRRWNYKRTGDLNFGHLFWTLLLVLEG